MKEESVLRPCSVLAHCLAVLLVWGAVTEVTSQQSGQSTGSEETSQPHDRLDVMGTYPVHNRLQCQKLCSYRQLCTSFSYHDNTDQGENCVLHSSHTEGDQSPVSASDWTEETVPPPTLPATTADTQVCHTRPCSVQEVCVPSPGKGPGYKCLLMPADCGSPSVANGRHVYSSTKQGDVATVQCEEHFVASPRHVGLERECQVNSRWTSFSGECVQAEYLSPQTPYVFRLPWQPFDVWKACIRGIFIGPFKLTFNLLDGPVYLSADILMHIDFRYTEGPLLLVSKRLNGTYSQTIRYREPPMPVAPNDSFTVSFRQSSTYLHLDLNDEPMYDVQLDDYPITSATYISSHSSVLHYVNLVAECPAT